jgi:UDP-N-acetylglucosamine 2-epimerase (non-hydrolysing)
MLVVGARPNLVKIAPIMAAMRRDGGLRPQLVHTGQHYDPVMSDIFFKELDIDAPAINLGVGSGTHAQQTGAVMTALESLLMTQPADLVLTVGDVNSTLAASLVAAKAGAPQAHVEAGLRSGDAGMPEEINRVVTDRLADLLFTHSQEADQNLRREGVPSERIHLVGNVMIDTLNRLRPRWRGEAVAALGKLPDEYGVVTLHRPSNVDDAEGLARIVESLTEVAGRIPLIFPVHPRTRRRLDAINATALRLEAPLGYLAFLDLVEHSRFVITDSGGIQEETTVLGIPCLTLRSSTERPVTVRLGTNRLLGSEPRAILPAVADVLAQERVAASIPPLWDGHAADRIVAVLTAWLAGPRVLRLAR